MSRTLSVCEPRNRCSGLTHMPLSQVWQTYIPLGIGPLNIRHAIRCAMSDLPAKAHVPYLPQLWTAPSQSQHVSVLRTLFRNAMRAVSGLNWFHRPHFFMGVL
jgi:hypothetical protein